MPHDEALFLLSNSLLFTAYYFRSLRSASGGVDGVDGVGVSG